MVTKIKKDHCTMNFFKLQINPCPKPRMTRSDSWRKRPCVTKYWGFKDKLVLEAKRHSFEIQEADMQITFYIPMPDSWSKKKKSEYNSTPHRQKPDIDNLLKAFFDCLCSDDSFIYDVRVAKYWGTSGSIEIRSFK